MPDWYLLTNKLNLIVGFYTIFYHFVVAYFLGHPVCRPRDLAEYDSHRMSASSVAYATQVLRLRENA